MRPATLEGVVHHDVQPAVLLDGGGDAVLDAVASRDVGDDAARLATVGTDLGGGGLTGLGSSGREHDRGAPPGKRAGDPTSHALTRAGHDRGPPGEGPVSPAHGAIQTPPSTQTVTPLT
jgi:hypothetical protein